MQLSDQIETLLPAHRERLFPPIEVLSMFVAQAQSAGGGCRQVVDEAKVKWLIGRLKLERGPMSLPCRRLRFGDLDEESRSVLAC